MTSTHGAALAAALVKKDPAFAGVVAAAPAFSLVAAAQAVDVYQALAKAIVYQQLHGKAAATIYARLCALGDVGVVRCPPPEALLSLDDMAMRAAGLSGAKTRALRDLAAFAQAGRLPTDARDHSDRELIAALTQVRGIGPWTVEMFLMFDLGRRDVMPVGDFGVRQGCQVVFGLPAMPSPQALLATAARWQPLRSVAAWYCWRAVELWRQNALPSSPWTRVPAGLLSVGRN